jgi:hypothetical protein
MFMRKYVLKKEFVVGIVTLWILVNIIPQVLGTDETYQSAYLPRTSTKPPLYQLSSLNLPTEEWSSCFGGTNYDWGYCAEQTNEGGYIITGGTRSFGPYSENIWLIKTYADGTMTWNTTLGSGVGKSVTQTMDTGYIIAGETNNEVTLVKTYPTGAPEWSNTYTPGYESDCGSVDQTYDGKYIIAGTGLSKIPGDWNYAYLMKVDTDGSFLWSSDFGHFWSNSYGYYAEETTDHGYILAGSTFEYDVGDGDIWLIKTDSNGIEQWNTTYNGPYVGDNTDVGFCVHQTSDGGYIIVGSTYYYNGTDICDVLLVKTDAAGNEQWNHTYNGRNWDIGYSVDQTTNGGYVIAGYSSISGYEGMDIWVIKTNNTGYEEWNTFLGGAQDDYGYSIQQTTDQGYIVAGGTYSYGFGLSDIWLIKLGAEDNRPPFPPSIMGKMYGKIGQEYYYTFVTTDPDNNEYYLMIDWGDGATSGWIGPYPSGEEEIQSHEWEETGSYTIRAKAKDVSGAESDWGTLRVTMPYEPPQFHFIEWLLERFPNALPILKYVFGFT